VNFVDSTEVVSPASDDVTMMSSSAANTVVPSREHPFLARLVSNDRVTPATHFQDVRLVTFDVEGSGIRYW
jgi:sulfite reductase alpha subunit-like flavoprotein